MINADKIKAVILGHAVGDALGVPVEFCSREELAKNPVCDMTGFGTYPYPAGSWSDDTSMTLCALESLSRNGLNLDMIMVNFGRWYYKDEFTPTGEMFDVGTTCSMAIDNYFAYKKGVSHCGLTDEYSNGNGSLMRIIPFVLYAIAKNGSDNYGALWNTAAVGSSLTHAHPRSIIACEIYATILSKLIENPTKESVFEALRLYEKQRGFNTEHKHFFRLFDDNFKQLDECEIKSTGYVVDTLEAAIWCLLTTDTYKDCVLKAVNLGEDTDTVAAVAGGLAGALYGLASIPTEWLNVLKKQEYICKLCERFFVTMNDKQYAQATCNPVGKTFQLSGTTYRVFAYNAEQKIALLEDVDGAFFGSITILNGVEYNGEQISAKQNITIFTSKQELFDRAKESGSEDITITANYIREKYYKMPKVICEMIAVAYLEENKENKK